MEIYSVFGVCEIAAAELLIKENKARKIPREEIPESELYHPQTKQKAAFALFVPDQHIKYFNQVIQDMRA